MQLGADYAPMESNNAVVQSKAAAELRRLIREQGRLKGWLAEQMSISPDRLTRILGGAAMTLDEAVGAARALDVPIETFIEDAA